MARFLTGGQRNCCGWLTWLWLLGTASISSPRPACKHGQPDI